MGYRLLSIIESAMIPGIWDDLARGLGHCNPPGDPRASIFTALARTWRRNYRRPWDGTSLLRKVKLNVVDYVGFCPSIPPENGLTLGFSVPGSHFKQAAIAQLGER